MQIKNLKQHVAKGRRLGFVTTGNRKRQKLDLKSRNWHWFQKGMNSAWTLEWRVWQAMGLLSHPWVSPQLGFSAFLDSSVGWDMHIHLPPWFNITETKTWPLQRSPKRPYPLGLTLPRAAASWLCTGWSCLTETRPDLIELPPWSPDCYSNKWSSQDHIGC